MVFSLSGVLGNVTKVWFNPTFAVSLQAMDKADECSGCIISEADLFVCETQSGLKPLPAETCMFRPCEYYQTWTAEAPTEDLKHFLQHCTGWQRIPPPVDTPCS